MQKHLLDSSTQTPLTLQSHLLQKMRFGSYTLLEMSHLALPFFKNPCARPFWLFLFFLSPWCCLQAREFVQRHPELWELQIVRSWGRREQDQEMKSPFPLLSGGTSSCSMSVPIPDPHPAALSRNLRNYISLSLIKTGLRDPPAHLPVLSAQGEGDSQHPTLASCSSATKIKLIPGL